MNDKDNRLIKDEFKRGSISGLFKQDWHVDATYLDGHDFSRAAQTCPQCFLHCVDALIPVARHLDIYMQRR